MLIISITKKSKRKIATKTTETGCLFHANHAARVPGAN